MNSLQTLNSLPLIIGLSLIIMGLLYILMPVRSLLRLDRKVTAWIYAAPNPAQRIEVVAAVSKTLGAFVALCGVIYVILTVGQN